MTDSVRSFYGRWAGVYDRLARFLPGVSRWRRLAVNALDLQPGDTVLDLGCGTGASLGVLRTAVAPGGRVIGVDRTPEMLHQARRYATRWPAVSVLNGDAMRPPVAADVDGILATFLVGLLEDPEYAVSRWRQLVGPDGRVALLDGIPTGWAPPIDRVFDTFVRAGAPPDRRHNALDRLTRRVQTAHDLLRLRGTEPNREDRALGLIRMTAANGGQDLAR